MINKCFPALRLIEVSEENNFFFSLILITILLTIAAPVIAITIAVTIIQLGGIVLLTQI